MVWSLRHRYCPACDHCLFLEDRRESVCCPECGTETPVDALRFRPRPPRPLRWLDILYRSPWEWVCILGMLACAAGVLLPAVGRHSQPCRPLEYTDLRQYGQMHATYAAEFDGRMLRHPITAQRLGFILAYDLSRSCDSPAVPGGKNMETFDWWSPEGEALTRAIEAEEQGLYVRYGCYWFAAWPVGVRVEDLAFPASSVIAWSAANDDAVRYVLFANHRVEEIPEARWPSVWRAHLRHVDGVERQLLKRTATPPERPVSSQ